HRCPSGGRPGHPQHLWCHHQLPFGHAGGEKNSRGSYGLAHCREDPMTASVPLSWSRMPAPIRALGRWITIVQLVGYTTSLLFIHHTTGMTPGGVAARYRGSEAEASDAAMQFPK